MFFKNRVVTAFINGSSTKRGMSSTLSNFQPQPIRIGSTSATNLGSVLLMDLTARTQDQYPDLRARHCPQLLIVPRQLLAHPNNDVHYQPQGYSLPYARQLPLALDVSTKTQDRELYTFVHLLYPQVQ